MTFLTLSYNKLTVGVVPVLRRLANDKLFVSSSSSFAILATIIPCEGKLVQSFRNSQFPAMIYQ